MNNPIATGKIELRKAGLPHDEVGYQMKFLDLNSIDDVIELQEIMAQALPDKEIFRLTTPEEFRDLLALQRSVIGVLTEDGLIAYNLVCFPGKDGDNFGADIGLAPAELEKVAHLKAVVVHPDYRGNQLQRKLAEIHQEVLRDLGYYHVCSTVSPKNAISIQNHFASGFVIKGLKFKYGDRLRYIMYKNIFRTFIPGPEVVGIDSADTDGQKMLIGRGFGGFEIQVQNDGNDCWRIMYSKPVSKLF
jgi:ribosomal protein S18 acetylase RimI-like enzyme